jgi:hypothetical protein
MPQRCSGGDKMKRIFAAKRIISLCSLLCYVVTITHPARADSLACPNAIHMTAYSLGVVATTLGLTFYNKYIFSKAERVQKAALAQLTPEYITQLSQQSTLYRKTMNEVREIFLSTPHEHANAFENIFPLIADYAGENIPDVHPPAPEAPLATAELAHRQIFNAHGASEHGNEQIVGSSEYSSYAS